MLKQELDHTEVDVESGRVHLHGDSTKVHEQGAFHANLVNVGSERKEDLRDPKTDAFVLKGTAIAILGQAGEAVDQRGLPE